MNSAENAIKIRARDLDFYYGASRALKKINLDCHDRKVTAIIGPSGCGKSTFIRTLNRMNDVIAGTRVDGEILIDGQDINAPDVDVVELRRRVGMVFQKPNPFPKSIYENVAFGARIAGYKGSLDDLVESSLNLRSLHTKNSPIEEDIFSPSQVGMKSSPKFNQC